MIDIYQCWKWTFSVRHLFFERVYILNGLVDFYMWIRILGNLLVDPFSFKVVLLGKIMYNYFKIVVLRKSRILDY